MALIRGLASGKVRRAALIPALFALFLLLPAVIAGAESLDLRQDTGAYCRAVAGINRTLEAGGRKRGAASDEAAMVLFRTGRAPLDTQNAAFDLQQVVYGPSGFSVLLTREPEAALSWLRAQDGVTAAEMDKKVSAQSTLTEGETVSFESWGAEAMGFQDYLPFVRQWGRGSVSVAVIDSGVYRHSLLSGRIRATGYDYIDNDQDPTNDLNGHGTRVAGIIADCSRDVPVLIYPIRVLDSNANGKVSNVISAVLEAVDAGVRVINLSLSTFSLSELLEQAIQTAVSSDITVVTAAGNYACDAEELTPARMTDAGVIVVGSADADGSRSSFSCYGRSVDVYAYGRGISACSRSGGYSQDTGTSMAAPHVSALAAMQKLVHPYLTPGGIEARIKRASSGSLPVPSATAMTPVSMGFMLEHVTLYPGETLELPGCALPLTCAEEIRYTVEDAQALRCADGVLTALAPGETRVTACAAGFEDVIFTVMVADGAPGLLTLPEHLEQLGQEALSGTGAHMAVIPEGCVRLDSGALAGPRPDLAVIPASVTQIAPNALDGTVILCETGTYAHEYALENGLPYITKTP